MTRNRASCTLAQAVLMIRPAQFAQNLETLATNRFQARGANAAAAGDAARREVDALAAALDAAGVRVHVFEGSHAKALPDEVFPNNWLSTHADGTIVIYPMQASSRRGERRPDILAWLEQDSGYEVSRILDLSPLEHENEYVEGTGSAVIDHDRRTAYCALSARTTPHGVAALADALDLEPQSFSTDDGSGFPIYHTNVMLALGATFAVACLEAIVPAERVRIRESLEASGREVIPITLAQMGKFAANLLALDASSGPLIALSTHAWQAFDDAAKRRLERHGAIVASEVATIERLGGGSVRCMLTEIFLPLSQ